ncbi:F-type H+-transporting ATPase subunit a [Butyrivibrio hungatei DSM 14810]|uniref:ATP synthase subunit a n=1 Tax=Butyrivibrio hungatei DSM 14810 TaxID=1121132 RepID=A0A1M7SB28_9FIRM|nr:F0F1 ATP synthase subunit A [Butyrivibrio hungatei]SHN55727.1 F-type H+-transporting ATPase subunit a [Butyrivibrio hungatei DSM 14810]
MKETLYEILMGDKALIHIPYGDGFFDIYKSVVVSWLVIAIVFFLILFMTRDLKVHNISKRQAAVESFVIWIRGVTGGMIGEEGYRYRDYLGTVLIFIAFSNMIGLFGLTPPTMDITITIALSIMSIILVEGAGIRRKGVGKWVKGFAQPMAVIAPMNVLELFIRPLSLCMRLFGNILGATVIMELIKVAMPLPVIVPAALSLYFDIFDGAIQAYVFVFLTSLYIKEALE